MRFTVDAASTQMYLIKSKSIEQQLRRKYATQLLLALVPRITETLDYPRTSGLYHDLNGIEWKYNSPCISKLIQPHLKPVRIELREMRSKIGGLFEGDTLVINSRILDQIKYDYVTNLMIVRNMIGTIMHEYAHFQGFFHGTGWFRNYRTKDKENFSVPYWLTVHGADYVNISEAFKEADQ